MHLHLCSVIVEDDSVILRHMATHNERTCGRVFPRSAAWEVTIDVLIINIGKDNKRA